MNLYDKKFLFYMYISLQPASLNSTLYFSFFTPFMFYVSFPSNWRVCIYWPMHRKIAGHSNSKEFSSPPVYKWRRGLCQCESECFVYYCVPPGKGTKIYLSALCRGFFRAWRAQHTADARPLWDYVPSAWLTHAQAIFLLFLSYPPVSLAITTLHTLQKNILNYI